MIHKKVKNKIKKCLSYELNKSVIEAKVNERIIPKSDHTEDGSVNYDCEVIITIKQSLKREDYKEMEKTLRLIKTFFEIILEGLLIQMENGGSIISYSVDSTIIRYEKLKKKKKKKMSRKEEYEFTIGSNATVKI